MDVIETGGVTSARNSWQNERLVTTTQVSGAYTEPLGTKPNSYITEMDDIIWDYTSTHDVNVNAPNIDMPTFDFDFGNMPRLNPDPYPPEKHLAFEAFNKDSPYDHVDDDVAGFGLAYDFDLNNLNKLNG
ncbi:hypothetical protein FACS1894166_05860 [Bacilli bacterium]|nr:hypothetical protein FACS1894166_05860 [Bacilli bacterium]